MIQGNEYYSLTYEPEVPIRKRPITTRSKEYEATTFNEAGDSKREDSEGSSDSD